MAAMSKRNNALYFWGLFHHLCFAFTCLVRTPWVFPDQLHFGYLNSWLCEGRGLEELLGAWVGRGSVSIVVGLEGIWGV